MLKDTFTEQKKLAENGNAQAQAYVGYCYQMGEGVPQSNDTAIVWYRKAVGGGNSDARAALIPLLLQLGSDLHFDNYLEAIKYYDQVLELDPAHIEALRMKSTALSNHERYHESTRCYQKILQFDPKNVNALSGIACNLTQQKDYNAAIEYYDKIAEIEPANEMSLNKVDVFKSLGRYEECLQVIDNCIEHQPRQKSQHLYRCKGLIYLDYLFDFNNAIICFERGMEVLKEGNDEEIIYTDISPNPISSTPLRTFEFLRLKAQAFAQLGAYEKAFECIEQGLQLIEKHLELRNDKNTPILLKSDLLRNLGRFADAESCLSHFETEKEKNRQAAHYYQHEMLPRRGILLLLSKKAKEDEVEVIFDQVLADNNKNHLGLLGNGIVALLRSNIEIAKNFFSQAENSLETPTDKLAHFHLKALVEFKLGFINDARTDCSIALQLKKDYLPVLNILKKLPPAAIVSQSTQASPNSGSHNPTGLSHSPVNLSAKVTAKPHAPLPATSKLVGIDVPAKQLTIDRSKPLGQGGFGVVYKGEWQMIPVAVKELLMPKMTAALLDDFRREAELMSQLRHPNIVTFYKVSTDATYSIVMEWCEKGSLYDWLKTTDAGDLSIRIKIGKQIAIGLTYLHSHHIIHRDLKSLNVLLDNHLTAKINDFGLSKIKNEAASTTGGMKGTVRWNPPELVSGQEIHHTEKTDVYSYGMVLWELLTRKLPYHEQNNNMLVGLWIAQGKKEQIPADAPPLLAALIEKCWNARSADRPTAHAAALEMEAVHKSMQPINSSTHGTAAGPAAATKSEYRLNSAEVTASPTVSPATTVSFNRNKPLPKTPARQEVENRSTSATQKEASNQYRLKS